MNRDTDSIAHLIPAELNKLLIAAVTNTGDRALVVLLVGDIEDILRREQAWLTETRQCLLEAELSDLWQQEISQVLASMQGLLDRASVVAEALSRGAGAGRGDGHHDPNGGGDTSGSRVTGRLRNIERIKRRLDQRGDKR
jgi:hypothetical protein